MPQKVMIVEDDADIAELLSLYMGMEGFDMLTAENGRTGLELLREEGAAAVIADIMMPEMDGFDFIRAAREFTDVPIIVVSAKTQVSDKALGLGLGADGYVVKPFDPLEVVALVKAQIRRAEKTQPAPPGNAPFETLAAGTLELDIERLVLRKRGLPIALTAAETKIMMKLMRTPGRVFTKEQLYVASGGEAGPGAADAMMVHMSNIRSKLDLSEEDGVSIDTVRGLGYKLAVRPEA